MPESKKNTDHFSGLPIWEYFLSLSRGNEEHICLVRGHINIVTPLLNYYIKAFPNYTLHNLEHAKNIIRLMGELMGDDIQKLSALEAAMLILSAIYHDIGMIFSNEEIKLVEYEYDFQVFLKQNIKANIEFINVKEEVTENLTEWYCRWAHAKRVWKFLNKFDQKHPLKWGMIPFKEELGVICESHNESVNDIASHREKFDTNFLGDCDLTFCAILLRLADILDFDNTRSPQSVFEFLELDKPQNNSELISKNEWLKHLHSDGFKFRRKNNNVELLYSAAPTHPNIETGIRKYLSLIEKEFNECAKALSFASQKWKEIQLPKYINVDNIKSVNYKSGNYHFSLSEEKLLTLLTGKGFYNNKHVFIRELLQNAIDTSRHRQFIERLTNSLFVTAPIEVSYFTDITGYQWIRIDDFGMGMNEDIIYNHLLKKGDSYYDSDKFQLEKLAIKAKIKEDFVPISRFGIGLLSCFMHADRIEINTKYFNEPSEQIRLSIEGRSGNFILQSSAAHHTASPMPSENGKDKDFRIIAGTSVAVRIRSDKESVRFNIKDKLEEFILCSPIQIRLNGQLIGGDFNDLLNNPIAQDQSMVLSEKSIKKVENFFGFLSFPEGIKIEIATINLSKDSFSANLKGQILFVSLHANSKKIEDPKLTSGNITFIQKDSKILIKFLKWCKIGSDNIETSMSIDITKLLNKIPIPEKLIQRKTKYNEEYRFNGIRLSHNGIAIDPYNYLDLNKSLRLEQHLHSSPQSYSPENLFLYSGIIYLQDELLPELTVDRNNIKSFSFKIVANILIATRAFEKYMRPDAVKFWFFEKLERDVNYSVAMIKKSSVYESNVPYWNNYIKVKTEIGVLDINELVEIVKKRPIKYGPIKSMSNFYRYFANYVLSINFSISILFENKKNGIVTDTYRLNIKSYALPECMMLFKPGMLFTFENSKKSLLLDQKINYHHPYIKWIILANDLISNNYTSYLTQLFDILYTTKVDQTSIDEINTILKRLSLFLPPEFAPSENVHLNINDFQFNELE